MLLNKSEIAILDCVSAFEGTPLATLSELDNPRTIKRLVRKEYLAIENGNDVVVTTLGRNVAQSETTERLDKALRAIL